MILCHFLPSSLPAFLTSFLPSSLPSFLPAFLFFLWHLCLMAKEIFYSLQSHRIGISWFHDSCKTCVFSISFLVADVSWVLMCSNGFSTCGRAMTSTEKRFMFTFPFLYAFAIICSFIIIQLSLYSQLNLFFKS